MDSPTFRDSPPFQGGVARRAGVVRDVVLSVGKTIQPIETCWAITKEYCAARCDYTMAGLKRHLDTGFDQVTPAVCQGLIQKVRDQEDQYWQEDEEDDNCGKFDDCSLEANESGFPEAEENLLECIIEE